MEKGTAQWKRAFFKTPKKPLGKAAPALLKERPDFSKKTAHSPIRPMCPKGRFFARLLPTRKKIPRKKRPKENPHTPPKKTHSHRAALLHIPIAHSYRAPYLRRRPSRRPAANWGQGP